MKIHELFSKPVERPIEGVIKADDDRYLQTEVEEYVVTGELIDRRNAKRRRSLSDFSIDNLEPIPYYVYSK